LKEIGHDQFILPDIQENDDSSFPSFKWFSRPERLMECIRFQAELLETLRPDRVLGVFNFTLPISAGLTGISYDSLICGCMLKDSEDILGFHGNEPDVADQKTNLDTFFSFATHKLNRALKTFTEMQINDVRDLLKGEMTYLWDFPEFMPLPRMDNTVYVGPVLLSGNGSIRFEKSAREHSHNPTAVLSFGTCSGSRAVLERLTRICLDVGFDVVIAAGGQKKYMSLFNDEQRVTFSLFPDLSRLLKDAALLITHGGQISIFEALKSKVPVLVMPFQPEQAHNGICLERIGCGRLLIPPRPFRAGPKVYHDAFDSLDDHAIKQCILDLRDNQKTAVHLAEACNVLDTYSGTEKLVAFLERPL
ncbi:MAG: glycosyltransferase, partial [Desulfobacula sp.]